MKEVRYINLGQLSGAEISAEHELTLHTDLETPLITSYCAKKPTLTMTGDYDINTYLYQDKIPKGVDIARIYSPKGSAGSLMLDNNSILIHLHIQDKYVPKNVDTFLLASIVRVMKKYDVVLSRSFHNNKSNDLVLFDNGKYKKIGGILQNSYKKGWKTLGILLCFKPNLEIMNSVFRMDTNKMKKRNVSHIKDVVVGIGNFDKNKISLEIAELIAKRIGFNLIKSSLSSEEKQVLDIVLKKISSKDWIYNAKR